MTLQQLSAYAAHGLKFEVKGIDCQMIMYGVNHVTGCVINCVGNSTHKIEAVKPLFFPIPSILTDIALHQWLLQNQDPPFSQTVEDCAYYFRVVLEFGNPQQFPQYVFEELCRRHYNVFGLADGDFIIKK